jgi:copper chaperone
MMVELKVDGMTCGHCVRAVTQAIERADSGAKVSVDLPSGTVRAETALDAAAIARLVLAEGYRVLA